MNWNWIITDDGFVNIYYRNELIWELECFDIDSEREINLMVKEFIMKNQHIMWEEE